ncbi:uncharacterized protein V1518DRAFT_416172 [Limtongia smithiae]|uniref:uncharacterized protein n=1 Tax=Limtongia smithiae TaxID=1125753 RepID=UPI0034CD5A1F
MTAAANAPAASVSAVLENLSLVASSAESATKCVDKLLSSKDLAELGEGSPGISLLALKADCMAAYLHALGVRTLFGVEAIAEKLENESADSDGTIAADGADNNNEVQDIDDDIRKLLVTERVVLERGVRPLEKKINYQVQKLLRATAGKSTKKAEKEPAAGDDEGSNSDQNSGTSEGEEDFDGDDLPLTYKPRPNLLVSADSKKDSSSSAKSSSSTKKYVPPKINPTKLPTAKPLSASQRRAARPHKNQALEEYISETTSTLPESAPSVGSNVLNHGRGGTRTQRAQVREDRVSKYEEENFTRLADDSKKKRKKPRTDEFMGETWDFGRGNSIYGAVKRKKRSVYDRSK